MKSKLILVGLWKSMTFTSLKILQNDFVHRIDIQVKIFKQSPFK
jgi:hypothetical protein